MFCWPCILMHPCNENQLDGLFILSLFRQSTSTCFGHICSPSSGGILYTYKSWYVLCFSVDCLLAGQQSTEQHNTYQLLYIYSIPPDDGLQICPKHVEVDWRNKLRINSASSWLPLHECFRTCWSHVHSVRQSKETWTEDETGRSVAAESHLDGQLPTYAA